MGAKLLRPYSARGEGLPDAFLRNRGWAAVQCAAGILPASRPKETIGLPASTSYDRMERWL